MKNLSDEQTAEGMASYRNYGAVRSAEQETFSFERLLETCGKPSHRGERWAIYQGDCAEYLAKLPSSSIKLTVTSPPYNIGKEYESILTLEEYISWSAMWISRVHECTAQNGALWLNLGYIEVPGIARAIPLPYLLWNHIPFYLIQEVIWNYGAGVASKKAFSPRNEKFLWYVKSQDEYTFNLDDIRDKNVKYPNQMKNRRLRCNPLGKNPSDVWQIPKVTSGKNRSSAERTPHPAQFPVAVIERIVKACSALGDTILDPFLGSGSSMEAAVTLGRACIGFETNETYVEIAARRLKSLNAQSILL